VSLRLRLLLAAGVVALIALVAADFVTYSALRSSLYQHLDEELSSASAIDGGGANGGPGPGSAPGGQPGQGGGDQGMGKGIPVGGGGAFVETRAPDGTFVVRSPGSEPGGKSYRPALPKDLHVPAARSSGPLAIHYFNAESTVGGGPQFRVAVSALTGGVIQIVALSLEPTTATLHQLVYIELAVTGAALAVALALGWLVVGLGLRPLVEMEATAEAIAEGALEARVPGADRRTEVGRLARALNVMLARIQGAFAERDATEASLRASEASLLASEASLRESEAGLRISEGRMRRFVADASHELRTPLAAVSAYAELFARGAADHPADLERAMLGIRGESSRMGRLVEDLLLLARLDEGRPLEHRPVELIELVADAVSAAAVVGPDWPVTLQALDAVEVIGDRERLRQVVDNLIANVRAHTPPGTRTVVRVRRSAEGEAVIEVADDGPGLSEDQARRVFDRFYRADASRARQTGGTGLGLSIVAAIVAAHGGTVTVSPSDPDTPGATFTVRLPAA
jgi:two-component system, OmpR family, sensor kinase